ncbi:MAG: DUF2207 domain-containing protein [Chloroflexi bacterium]|nr:MAG: DUF2207 domain-containing protein [Chloroflexota bacterium]
MRERTGFRWRVMSLLVVMLGLVTAGTIPATADEGWSIDAFDVAITIQSNATMTVRETLQVDFNSQQHHGIFRDIPVLYEWDQRHNRAYDLAVDSVTDASGRSWSYKVLDNGVYKEIKIGDPNQTLSGRQSYVIAYTVKGALNGFADHDELYWNVTGNQWAVPIKEASATVTAPAGGLLWTHCFQGETGSRETCRESSTAGQGEFVATRVLDAGQQLTVVVGMKKGVAGDVAPILRAKPRTFLEYFSVEPLTVGSALLLLLLGAAWLGRMVWRRGRDMEYASAFYSTKDPTERVRPLFRPEAVVPEYRPPDNLRPAQLGLILDEVADTKDLTATIVDMAVRGYVIIKSVNKQDWELVPAKDDTRDLLPYEEKILHGLFDGSKSGTRLSTLKGTFSGTLHAAERLLYGDSVRLKWFTTDPQSTRVRWALLGVLVVAVGVGVTWVLGALAGWGLLGIAVILIGGGMIVANRWMPRRTGLGTDLFRKTLGFRLYMTRAEKDRQAFAEKAEIFTQYLPYAIVFGCVHRWAKAFEGIDTSAAVSTWYQGAGPFYPVVFASSLEGFSSTLSTTIAQTPAGSGGSGGGGGGFSGGGGGGGGGGAW